MSKEWHNRVCKCVQDLQIELQWLYSAWSLISGLLSKSKGTGGMIFFCHWANTELCHIRYCKPWSERILYYLQSARMSDKLTHFIISKLTFLKRDPSLSWRQAAKEDNFQIGTLCVHIPTAVLFYSFACAVISFDEGQYFFPWMLMDSPCICMHLLQANIWDILSFPVDSQLSKVTAFVKSKSILSDCTPRYEPFEVYRRIIC